MKTAPRFKLDAETTLREDFRLLLIMWLFMAILKLAPKGTKSGYVIVCGLREILKVIVP